MKYRVFAIFIDEIKQNFVFGDRFEVSYTKTVTLSDGTVRTVRLTPRVREGQEVMELNIDGHVTYMGPNSTTTNCDTLMVSVREWPEDSATAALQR